MTVTALMVALVFQTSQPHSTATATATATETTAGNDADIVVLAHRLKKVRWEYEAKNGTLSKCEIKRTSGSVLVDALICRATARCAREQPNLTDAELLPCIRERVSRPYAAR